MEFEARALRSDLDAARADGIFIGTSSWKYPGWIGQLYDGRRYAHHGKLSESRFERECLTEYAELFSTVCVDAGYYRFPDADSLRKLVAQTEAQADATGDLFSMAPAAPQRPPFLFSFKVTDEITIRRYPNLPRHGKLAGTVNPRFLDAEVFAAAFLQPCESIRSNVGVLMFEFSTFHDEFARVDVFTQALDAFLGQLPKGWRYGVEVRNPAFLHPDYFAMLRSHGVSHVFNSWTAMPPIEEQWAMPEAHTSEDFFAARFLLKPGRTFEEAVTRFKPYKVRSEPNPAALETAAKMLMRSHMKKSRHGMVYVNNRFEGNALKSIAAMLERARLHGHEPLPPPTSR